MERNAKIVLFFLMIFYFISCSKKTNELDSNLFDSKVEEKVENSTQQNYSKEIKIIKDNFKRINEIKAWTVIDSVELDDSTEGGQAKFYFKDKHLQKVSAIYYGETGKKIVEYYLLEGKLSFVFEKEFNYNRPIYWSEPDDEVFDIEKSEINEIRSYFANEVLFEQVNKSKEMQEVFNHDLEKSQETIKENYNSLKQLSLVRQI